MGGIFVYGGSHFVSTFLLTMKNTQRKNSKISLFLPLILLVIPFAGDALDWVHAKGDVPLETGQSAFLGERIGQRVVDVELAEEPQPQSQRQGHQRSAQYLFELASVRLSKFDECLAEGGAIKSLLLFHRQLLPIAELFLSQFGDTWGVGRFPSNGREGIDGIVCIVGVSNCPKSDNLSITDSGVNVVSGGAGVVGGQPPAISGSRDGEAARSGGSADRQLSRF